MVNLSDSADTGGNQIMKLIEKLKRAACYTVATFAIIGPATAGDVIKIGVPTGLSGANSVVAPAVVPRSWQEGVAPIQLQTFSHSDSCGDLRLHRAVLRS